MKDNKVESVIVKEGDLEVWSEQEQRFVINAKSNFYIIDALGNYHFYLTRDRLLAQQAADTEFGVGKYKIRSVNDTKTKAKTEFGLTCTGSNSRKGFGSWLKKS